MTIWPNLVKICPHLADRTQNFWNVVAPRSVDVYQIWCGLVGVCHKLFPTDWLLAKVTSGVWTLSCSLCHNHCQMHISFTCTPSPTNWRAACTQFRTLLPGLWQAPGNRIILHVLCQLHWLPVWQHIVFKITTLVHRSLSGNAPGYMADDCQLVTDARVRQLLLLVCVS